MYLRKKVHITQFGYRESSCADSDSGKGLPKDEVGLDMAARARLGHAVESREVVLDLVVRVPVEHLRLDEVEQLLGGQR